MTPRPGRAEGLRARGSALIVVLLALALLFSLAVPYLVATRARSENANRAWARAEARLAADAVHGAVASLQAGTHPVEDPTPLWDAPDEWDPSVLGPLPDALGGPWQGADESWGAEVEATQSLVSLATAPPMLLQNLVHPCYLTTDVTQGDAELPVTSTEGFPDQGMLYLGGEVVPYTGRRPNAFTGIELAEDERAQQDDVRFQEGSFVLDPRFLFLALARLERTAGPAPAFPGELLDGGLDGDPATLLPEAERRRLAALTTLRSGGFGAGDLLPGGWLAESVTTDVANLLVVGPDGVANAGTTLRLEPEVGPPSWTLVLQNSGPFLLVAGDQPNDLEPFQTRVRPLRPDPVDLNACPGEVLEALALGVSFRGRPPVESTRAESQRRREWVDPNEARAFARRVLRERPLRGPDDLWDRVLQPLAEEGALSTQDAWALFFCGIAPTHPRLRQATTGFAYRSGDRYLARFNAAVRSRLGRTLARRSEWRLYDVVPEGVLTTVLTDQEVFDDLTRWGQGLHGVVTLPNNLGRWSTSWREWPSGATLRLGTDSQIGRVLPSREVESFAFQPEPVAEADPGGRSVGRTLHFDVERSPLGRDVRERGPYTGRLADFGFLMRDGFSGGEPFVMEAWFTPAGGVGDAALFDVGGVDLRRNRVALTMEGGELVLRAWDAAGDDPADPDGLEQAWTVRVGPQDYVLDGHPFHANVVVRGVGPDAVQFAVDGVPRGREEGRTWLTAATSSWVPGDPPGTLAVESTEGFPNRGVLRIGDEVIEYSSRSSSSFDLQPADGIGGRAVRERDDTLALARDTDHPAGAGVSLYGYSALLAGDVPPGGGSFSGEVGPWSLAVAPTGYEDVQVPTLSGMTFSLGRGITRDWVGTLDLAAMFPDDPYYAEAFQSDGGFALIWQPTIVFTDGSAALDVDGARVGGMEVVRYASRSGSTIEILERNVPTPGFVVSEEDGAYLPAGNSFVMEWADYLVTPSGTQLSELELMRVHVMPISIHGNGVSDLAYAPATPEYSAFVQFTPAGADGDTEWVRYDSILDGNFLRDEWQALNDAIGAYYRGFDEAFDPFTGPPGSGGGGAGVAGGGPLGGGAFLPFGPVVPRDPAGRPFSAFRQDPVQDPYLYRPRLGQPVERVAEIDRILRRLDFRGTMGTYDHAQRAGTPLVPVFTTARSDSPDSGWVGRLDRVAVMQPQSGSGPPDWFTVRWAAPWRPLRRVRPGVTYVAFDTHPGLPYLGTAFQDFATIPPGTDVRTLPRLVKFPSGELPRRLDSLVVGGDLGSIAPTFPGWVDEVSVRTADGMGDALAVGAAARGAFVLVQDLPAGDAGDLVVDAFTLVIDGRRTSASVQGQFLQALPTSGLLVVDGERIAYDDVDATQGRIRIAPNGRGLHGTQARAHAAGARVWIADGRPTTSLTSDVGPGDAELLVEDATRFAPGTALLVDRELLHAPLRSLRNPTVLAMPRHRRADALDELGDGALRGRFGTTPAAHAAGTLVYAFPTRWYDGWEPEAWHPSGVWCELGFEASEGEWRGLAWEEEIPDPTLSVRVLARVAGVPWDADPDRTPGLVELEGGRRADGGFLPLGLRGDRLELRFHFDWGPGSFDPTLFTATGWTRTPLVRRVVLDWSGHGRVRRVREVHE